MFKTKTLLSTVALTLTGIAVSLALQAAPAQASHTQQAMFEADQEVESDPVGTMDTLRSLGVSTVRVNVEWSAVAPNPLSYSRPAFDASNPSRYPAANWARYDNIVRAAVHDHLGLDFLITGGAPFWAIGHDVPQLGRNIHFAWKPSAAEYGAFVRAIATRYGSSVRMWELWNEPNFGEDLGPQAANGSQDSVAPKFYRGLLDAGWNALRATGHGNDTIIIGDLAARGMQGPVTASHPEGLPGNFAQTKPLQFIRTLYCLDRAYRPLRGSGAARIGCPTTAAGTGAYARQHPALFSASGFGIHPYPQGLPPTQETSHDPDFAAFPEIPTLEQTLDRVQRAYGSRRRLPIYNTEYGYVTRPPAGRGFASPAMAALYLNWAEYLSWKDSRVASYMQYLLRDPPANGGSRFFSGLIDPAGRPKVTYYAFRMPLFLPNSNQRRGHSLEVWGCARPAHAYRGAQQAQIQFQPGSHGRFTTVAVVPIADSRGYFDVRVRFPGSGLVRILWSYPSGSTITSRTQAITVL